MSRINRKGLRAVAFGVAFSLAVAAFAYFAATFIAEGSHEGTTGKGIEETLPALVSFPDGLTPEQRVPVTVEVENNDGHEATFTKFTLGGIETPAVPKCGSEWLKVAATTEGSVNTEMQEVIEGKRSLPKTLAVKAGETKPVTLETSTGKKVTFYLEFKSSLASTTNQSSCEETAVVVNAHLE